LARLAVVLLSVFLLLSLLPAVNAQALPSFLVAPSYAGQFPVAIADFNQDGHLDIVNGQSVLLGNGDGTFKTGTPLNVVLQPPYFIATADFNGDGKPDVAFLDIGGAPAQPILIFLGKGDGTFQSPINIKPGSSFSYFLVADVNSDGKPDLLTSDGGALSVYLGNGDSTFTQVTPNFMVSGLDFVGDFNGDGKIDVIWGQGNNVYLALGNGDGTFKTPTLVSAISSSGVTVVAVADFNSDRRLDIGIVVLSCTISSCNYNFAVQLGNGDGTFQPPGTQAFPVVSFSFTYKNPVVAVGDFNGDGKPDVAYASVGPFIGVLQGNGDGTFTATTTYAVGDGNAITGLAVADFTGDQRLDIIGGPGAYVNGNISVLIGRGDATFEAAPAISLTNPAIAAVTADFNGDGKPDVAGLGDSSVSILLNTAGGLTTETHSYSLGTTGADFIAAVDLTAKGKQDLVVEAYPQSNLANLVVLLGNGDGTFASPLSVPDCGGLTHVRSVADLNGDHKPDVVATDGTMLYICLGNGDGTFGIATKYFAGNGPGLVVIGDFNGDSKPDLAVLNPTAIGMLLGNGDGTFQAATFPILYSTPIYSLAAGDVNLDGKLDLVAGGQYQLQVYLGNGDGTFRTLSPQPGSFVGPMSISDLNGDGSPDLLAPSDSGSGCGGGFYLGNGDGTFSVQHCLPYGLLSVVADFNGDGQPDIVSPDFGYLNVIINTTVSNFTVSAVAPSPASVSPGGSATSTITISATGGFKTSVTLSCSITPATSAPPACSFSPATLANGAGTSTLTIITTGATALVAPQVRGFRLVYATWLPVGAVVLIGAGFRTTTSRKRELLAQMLGCMMLMCLVVLAACGGGNGGSGGGSGGGSSSGTPAGTYTIMIMGSAPGFQTQTTAVTITVQ